MGDKDGKWERFQLTMPITRSDLLRMQYLGMTIAVIISVALVVVTIGAGVFLQGEIFEDSFMTGIFMTLPSIALPFLMSGISLPLASSKIGRGREGGVLTLCQFAAIGIMLTTPWLVERFGVSLNVFGVLLVAASVLIFIISYFITRVMYARMDF